MTNSKQKGSAGERELVNELKAQGFDAHRSQQFCGKGEDASDVICYPLNFLHFECKRVEKLNIDNAMAQAIRDARAGKIPVVAHRKNRGDWLTTLRLSDFLSLVKRLPLVLCFCLVSMAEAQHQVRVHLVKISGDHELSLPNTGTVWDSAAALTAQAGVSLRLARVTLINDIKPQYGTLNQRVNRLYYWANQARRRGYFRKVDVVHFLFPPIKDKGQYWFAGLAYNECARGQNSISYSNGGTSTGGTVQIRKSAVAVAHEILHILGAKHSSQSDLMNTGALALVDSMWPLPVSQITTNEVNLCQQRRAKRVRRKAARKAANF